MPRTRNKEIDQKLGQRVRSLRRSKDMTQRAMAEKLDVTNTLIQAYESGRIRLSVSTLAELAKVLGVTLGEMVEGL